MEKIPIPPEHELWSWRKSCEIFIDKINEIVDYCNNAPRTVGPNKTIAPSFNFIMFSLFFSLAAVFMSILAVFSK